MNWREQLTKVALLGTERYSSALPEPPDPLAQPFERLGRLDRESALLGALGLAAVYRLAGKVPDSDPGPVPDPCPADPYPVCAPGAALFLTRILAGENPQLMPEFLAGLRSVEKRIPEDLLPAILELGRSQLGVREAAHAVIGGRGRWLAAQNPENWAWAVGSSEAVPAEEAWHTGSREQRLALLRRLRMASPSAAIPLLESTWTEEIPEDRAAFVAALEFGLATSDEPFLEKALDDRRKEVRGAAAQLLAGLPDSSLIGRMQARLHLSWQEATPGSILQLKRAAPARIAVDLPRECDKAMQRDGIEPKPKAGTGEKAWWLEQMLGAVPPVRWSGRWSKTPGEVIEAGLASEWSRPLLNGWLRAALRHPDREWAAALLTYWTNEGSDDRRIELYSAGVLELLGQLEQSEGESFVAELTKGDRLARSLFWLCLPYLRGPWALPFSTSVVNHLRFTLNHTNEAPPGFSEAIRHASLAVDPGVASELQGAEWQIPSQMWGIPAAIDNLVTVVHFRKEMLKELAL